MILDKEIQQKMLSKETETESESSIAIVTQAPMETNTCKAVIAMNLYVIASISFIQLNKITINEKQT